MMRYLIWDADGTLFNTYPAIVRAMQRAVKKQGGDAPLTRIEALVKVSYGHCFGTLSAEQRLDEAALRDEFEHMLQEQSMWEQAPFPGVRDMCAYAIAVGGANYVLTHRDKGSLTALLKTHTMARFFSDTLTKDDPYPRKPDPAGLNALLERHSIPHAEALVIGDRELDILTAHAAGVRACFFGSNPHSEPAEFEIHSYIEFLEKLRQINMPSAT